MQSITDNSTLDKIPAVFHLGFRIFFLSGAMFAVIALLLWGTQFFHGNTINPYVNSFWWHSHEMVFGFCVAIISGFLLTAVQNWTGIPSVKGYPLIGLFIVWLAGRLLLLFPGNVPTLIISSVDLMFIPLVALALAYPIIKIKQWRNLIFVPILLLLFLENFLVHRGLWLNQAALSQNAIWASVFTIILLISIMGGRVIPFFTAKATATEKPSVILALELSANLPILAIIIYFISSKPALVTNHIVIALYSIAAAFQLIRMLRWQFWLCFKNPMLWSLHASYIFLPMGLAMLALNAAGFPVTTSQALHGITVGTMGGLMLSMISRVSLGHTGRQLAALPGMQIAFVLMIIAAVFRSPINALQLISPSLSLAISFVCFILAYGIFVWVYFPILVKKRIDGRAG